MQGVACACARTAQKGICTHVYQYTNYTQHTSTVQVCPPRMLVCFTLIFF